MKKQIKLSLFFIIFAVVFGSIFYATSALADLPTVCHNPGMHESELNISPTSGSDTNPINIDARFRWTNAAPSGCTDVDLLFTLKANNTTVENKVEVGKNAAGQWKTRNFTVVPSTLGIGGGTQINFKFLVEEDGYIADEDIVMLQKVFSVDASNRVYACLEFDTTIAEDKYNCGDGQFQQLCADGIPACSGGQPCVQVDESYCGQSPGSVISIVNISLPDATIGRPYNQEIQAIDGTEPYAWTQIGSLPAGLSFNAATGVISGTPTTAGASSFSIRVTDQSSPPKSAEKAFTIKVDETGGPPAPGATQSFEFSLDNPLEADNFLELIDVLATWLFNLSIPVVVVMIVWSGIMFLTSRGDTTKVTKARQILLYAVVGFAIILIGKGFITLIESILNLGQGP